MSKRLDPCRPLGPQLRRACLAEIRAAQAVLAADTPDDAGVHALRRACKRARAVLRLLRPALPAHSFRDVDACLRDAARALAGARDASVVVRTAQALGIESPRALGESPGPDACAAAAAALARAGAALPARCPMTAAALGRASARVYRQARRRYAAVNADPSDAGFHALRRVVKYHAHHIRLLRRLWPEYFEVWWTRLDALADLLGQEHDLTVLHAALPDTARAAADRARVRERQAELRTQALREAAVLFAERPRALGKRLAAYWTVHAEVLCGGTESKMNQSDGRKFSVHT